MLKPLGNKVLLTYGGGSVLDLDWEKVHGIVINPFGKYIQMTKKMIELLISGYEYYEKEREEKEDGKIH